MGSDKGLLLKDSKPWAVLMSEKIRHAGLDVVISVNEKQVQAYKQIFPNTPLIIDDLPINGPLEGLLSTHKTYPDKDLLLMACDLIDMDELTIGNLISVYQNRPSFEYYVYEQNGFTQPFCAIYTSKALVGIYEALEKSLLNKYSLHDRFESGNTLYLPVIDEKSFRNYNQL